MEVVNDGHIHFTKAINMYTLSTATMRLLVGFSKAICAEPSSVKYHAKRACARHGRDPTSRSWGSRKPNPSSNAENRSCRIAPSAFSFVARERPPTPPSPTVQ